jgi:hypothetical protein
MSDEALEKIDGLISKNSLKREDLKEIFDSLSADEQDKISNRILDRIGGDKRLNGTWDETDLMVSKEMCSVLKAAVFKKISDGTVDGGKAGDALNKFWLKLVEQEAKILEQLIPPGRATLADMMGAKDVENVEIKITKGVVKKVVDGEFKEVK